VYISDPTWGRCLCIITLFGTGNHKNIFNAAGIPIAAYRYYDLKANALDLTGFLEDLNVIFTKILQ
jgi:aspartate/tyrosine/aromatic aminotransferase